MKEGEEEEEVLTSRSRIGTNWLVQPRTRAPPERNRNKLIYWPLGSINLSVRLVCYVSLLSVWPKNLGYLVSSHGGSPRLTGTRRDSHWKSSRIELLSRSV